MTCKENPDHAPPVISKKIHLASLLQVDQIIFLLQLRPVLRPLFFGQAHGGHHLIGAQLQVPIRFLIASSKVSCSAF